MANLIRAPRWANLTLPIGWGRDWILTGIHYGGPALHLKAIEEVLLRISHLTEAIPEISELDLNPNFALPPG